MLVHLGDIKTHALRVAVSRDLIVTRDTVAESSLPTARSMNLNHRAPSLTTDDARQ